MTSRPGMELPQAPFWLAGLAVHGEASWAMKIGWLFTSKMLLTAANSFRSLITSSSKREFHTQNAPFS